MIANRVRFSKYFFEASISLNEEAGITLAPANAQSRYERQIYGYILVGNIDRNAYFGAPFYLLF